MPAALDNFPSKKIKILAFEVTTIKEERYQWGTSTLNMILQILGNTTIPKMLIQLNLRKYQESTIKSSIHLSEIAKSKGLRLV